MTHRRDFLSKMGTLGSLAAFGTIDLDEMRADAHAHGSAWDTSWLDSLAAAQYRVVFNASEVADGAVFNYAQTFLDHFHEVHATTDRQTRPVAVIRRLGTALGLNDAMWDRYAIGADLKLNDPATHQPARRNIYWSAPPGASPQTAAGTIQALRERGLINLVCAVALGGWSRGTAERLHLDASKVLEDAKANLIPGAILVPSGIYALIRAQNAGCAWMPGT